MSATTTSPDQPDPGPDESAVELEKLDHPAEPLRPVVATERDLLDAAASIAAGVGPVAIDAERASGYRYGQKAYLVQLRREGSGTWLIDPMACPDLGPVAAAIGSAEWILHAATQDLPCLSEVGLRPTQLFDTELAARLLGLPRVGLAAVVEHYLGLVLAKEHSAVDWSTRPLPEPWLRYAALDVEVLVDLRNLMGVDLARQEKAQWAREEFTALLTWAPTERVDPWRRTSGISSLRTPRHLAELRELWFERDRIAQDRDTSPGRVLPDAGLVSIVTSNATSAAQLPTSSRAITRLARHWLGALDRARALPDAQLPPRTLPSDGPPPVRAWPDKDPTAAARLATTRADLMAYAEGHDVPVENVCSPEPLRRVVWSPPAAHDAAAFTVALGDLGVRPWQAAIVAPMLVAAFAAHPD